MTSPTDITAAIHGLLGALEHDDSYLEDPLSALGQRLRSAVGSFLGLELTLYTHGQPVTVRSWDDTGSEVATSLHLPAGALLTPTALGGLTFWAATAGAFVDLAADLTHALALVADTVVLDAHLGPARDDGIFGLADTAVVNQAVGALMAAGHPAAAALAQLELAAAGNGLDLADQARRTLADLPAHPDRA